MKTKTKIGMLLIVSLVFLSLSTMAPSAQAGKCEHNKNCSIWYAKSTEYLHQNVWDPHANDLHFKVYGLRKKSMCGYSISVSAFPQVQCMYTAPDRKEVMVIASGANIAFCTYVKIEIRIWYDSYDNLVAKKDIIWTYEAAQELGPPNHGWIIDSIVPTNIKNIFIGNEDPARSFTIANLKYRYGGLFENLESITGWTAIPGEWVLGPGESIAFDVEVVLTETRYVYVYWKMLEAPAGAELQEEWFGHRVTEGVGGFDVPVNKLALLAPMLASYMALVSAVAVGAVVTVVSMKRKREK